MGTQFQATCACCKPKRLRQYSAFAMLWYDRLQLFRPLAIDQLRNAWGNVDEEGHRVYDVMQRVKQIFVPYDMLGNTAQEDSAERRMETSDTIYETSERPPAVIVQCQGKTAPTKEIA